MPQYLKAIFLISIFILAPINVFVLAHEGYRHHDHDKQPPTFKEYKVKNKFKRKAIQLDLFSHPRAKKFKIVLNRGMAKGANFADHYIIVTIGCGTMCQENWIINALDGKIIDSFYSELGIKYNKNSNLIIVNPFDKNFEQLRREQSKHSLNIKTSYIVFRNHKFETIYEKEL